MIFTAGCQNSSNNKQVEKEKGGKLNIYTTVYPLQFITEQIGGESVDVKTIYPPGTDEHTFEPSQRDMIDLAEADLFFYIGLGLESFVGKAESTLKNEHVSMIAVGESLLIEGNHAEYKDEQETDDHAEHNHHHHGDVDPHVWIDPILTKEMASQILATLIEKMPEQQQIFENNYQKLAKQLDELDAEFSEVAANAKRKKFIVPHAAYGYWELKYGIEQISIAGLSSTNEPSQKRLKQIIDVIKDEQVPYILYEQNVSSKLVDVIREATGVKALSIHNLAILTEENIKNQDNYLTIMKSNVEVLKKALDE